jgi:hypothetical protein
MSSTTEEVTRAIQLPFPCGCIEQHSAPNGFAVEEYTCDTHVAINSALQHSQKMNWKTKKAFYACFDAMDRACQIQVPNPVGMEFACKLCGGRFGMSTGIIHDYRCYIAKAKKQALELMKGADELVTK